MAPENNGDRRKIDTDLRVDMGQIKTDIHNIKEIIRDHHLEHQTVVSKIFEKIDSFSPPCGEHKERMKNLENNVSDKFKIAMTLIIIIVAGLIGMAFK